MYGEGNRDMSFVHRVERQKTAYELEMQEMIDDLSAFPEEVRGLVEKKVGGEMLTGEERKEVAGAISKWWQDKYGFPYDMAAERRASLLRKHAPTETRSEIQDLQARLFEAVKKDDAAAMSAIKTEYHDRFREDPETLEGIMALFQVVPMIERQRELDRQAETKRGRWDDERCQLVKEAAEDNFLMSHFILMNNEGKELLRAFWSVAEQLAREAHSLDSFNRMRKGILSQVAVQRVAERIGLKPYLSHPTQDAFNAIDMWTDAGEAVQIKGGSPDLAIVPSDETAATTTEVMTAKGPRLIDSYLLREHVKFRGKLKKYSEVRGQETKGFLFTVPYSEFDAITGEPTDAAVEFLRDNLPEELRSGDKPEERS
jgi:hypothetical protein